MIDRTSTPTDLQQPSGTAGGQRQLKRPLRGVPALALVATAGFAAGTLVTQTTVVPAWQSMEPSAFLSHFSTHGPGLGATLFPAELVSVLLLGQRAWSMRGQPCPGRRRWLAATGCMVGTMVLLPLYFAGANRALLHPDFPPSGVAGVLTTWYAWNWLRTGLAVVATGLAISSLVACDAE